MSFGLNEPTFEELVEDLSYDFPELFDPAAPLGSAASFNPAEAVAAATLSDCAALLECANKSSDFAASVNLAAPFASAAPFDSPAHFVPPGLFEYPAASTPCSLHDEALESTAFSAPWMASSYSPLALGAMAPLQHLHFLAQNFDTNYATIQDLPSELIDRVANLLDRESLQTVRLANRFLEAHTHNTFVNTFFRDARVLLTVSGLERAISRLKCLDDAGSKVQDITFEDRDPGTGALLPLKSLQPASPEFCRLLESLLTQTPNIRAISLKLRIMPEPTHEAYFLHQYPSTIPYPEFAQALTKAPLPKLTTFSISGGSWDPKVELEPFFRGHTELNSISLGHLMAWNSSWADVLRSIGRNTKAQALSLHGLYNEATSFIPVRTSMVRCVKNPGAKLVEYYYIKQGWATMVGEKGVKAGIEKLLEITGLR